MRPGRRNALLLAGIGAAAVAGGAIVGALAWRPRTGAAQLLAASFPDLQGRRRRVLDWRGQVLACNFWATWCAPCREEVPLLVAARQQHAQKGFEVLGIGIDNAAKIAEFAAIYRINYPILISDSSAVELMRELGNSAGGLPYTVFLDRAGSVAHRKIGALREVELTEILTALLS